MSHSENFVSNYNIPDFIKQDHDLFETFIKAYYEWLEIQKDSENNNYSDVYKAVGNPGYIINNQEIVVDIDDTIDQFVDYFANEVVPISLEGIQTNPRFFLKKIRDLYLAKGTSQSFILFFKLYYNDNIDVFETRDTVLRASDGKYFNFPTAYFTVSEGQQFIGNFDFTLSNLLDGSEEYITSVLSGTLSGETKTGRVIVSLQFAGEMFLAPDDSYYITSADGKYKLKLSPMISLSSVSLKDKGALYETKDQIFVKSKGLDNTYFGSVTSTTTGSVSGVKVRDRGRYYTTGDYFEFTDGNTNGGRFDVTNTSFVGQVDDINNIKLRSGSYNNGYLSNFLEDVYVGIAQGGSGWKTLPDVEYVSVGTFDSDVGDPYIRSTNEGYGLQVIPVSNTIGQAQNIKMDQAAYFLDSDDALVAIPANVVTENINLNKGDIVAFQHFNNEANFGPFIADSESIKINFKAYRLFDTHIETEYTYRESEIRTNIDITIPYGFDSDTFDWKYKNARIDSNKTNIWEAVEELLANESNLSYKINKKSYDVDILDGGVYPGTFFVEVFHPYDSLGNKLEYKVQFGLGYSAKGDFTDYKSVDFFLDADDDSDVFNDVLSFINNYNGADVSIDSAVMLDAEVIDGGDSYSLKIYDSEYDGGSTFKAIPQSLIEGWPSFEYSYAKYSYLEIKYPLLTSVNDSEIGYQEWGFDADSDTTPTVISGGKFYGFSGATVEEIEIEFEGQFLSTLEHYHFNQLAAKTGLDSEYLTFEYDIIVGEKRILDRLDDSDMGIWVDTGHYGEVVGVSHNNKVVKIIEWKDYSLPLQEEIDAYSFSNKEIVRLSKLTGGVSNKNTNLPINNVVHEIKRAKLEYETSVVSNLITKFYNQDGFISSDFGGTLQDNYFYSDWSYRIKSKLPFADWKDKFKALLHPAGMVLTSEYLENLDTKFSESNIDLNIPKNSSYFTFDRQNEYIDTSIRGDGVTADNINYASNAFETYNKTLNYSYQLEASNGASLTNIQAKQQAGNAFWDYEPIGWVGERTYDVKSVNGNYINLDSETHFRNKISTQDSDGTGHVANNYTYYRMFKGDKQDFYKNESRLPKRLVKNYMISKVQFEDLLYSYNIYDSELSSDFILTFNDSDKTLKAIDYNKLKNDSDNRTFFLAKINRLAEIKRIQELDLQLAMQEENKLVWDDSDRIYYDYAAYERKWNQINNKRTINIEGYAIKGKTLYDSYHFKRKHEEYRGSRFIPNTEVQYSLVNAPFNNASWSEPSVIWQQSYFDKINKIVGNDVSDETYRDPRVSMRGRRGR